MIDIREFIRNLGDSAPTVFDVKPETIKRWIKTGNVPIKVAQKIFAMAEAIGKTQIENQGQQKVASEGARPLKPEASPNEDPLTHLPINIDKRLPQVQFASGQLPPVIEMSPTEQSFGNNFTRPGRVSIRPLPPMKIKEVDGQKVAFVEDTPALADMKDADGNPIKPALPPTIAQDSGWAKQGPPLPQPIKSKDEARADQATAKSVSTA